MIELTVIGGDAEIIGTGDGRTPGGSIVCADVTSIPRDISRKWVGETVRSQLCGAD